MNEVKKVADNLFQIINELPKDPVLHLLEDLDKEQTLKIFSYTLQYYGGSFSHDFLIKFNKIALNFHSDEWKKVLTYVDYNVFLGKDSLYSFFLFHTNMRSIDFFETIGISSDIRSNYSADILNSSYFELPLFFRNRNLKKYHHLGLEDKEVAFINQYCVTDVGSL